MNSTSVDIKGDLISPQENQTLQFVAMFVHDLEGPLVSLKTLVRFMERQTYDPSKPIHKELLESSKIALGRAETVVYDLLTAARAGTGDLPVRLENCDLINAISDSCQMVRPAAAQDDISIREIAPAGGIMVLADPVLLGRVLDNLIYNAIRHSPPGGEIIVEAARREDVAEVLVTDSGPGLQNINPEDLFTIYKQADFRARGLHRGVGIGLYLCRLALGKMGGEITAGNSTDQGACFRFTLKFGGKTA